MPFTFILKFLVLKKMSSTDCKIFQSNGSHKNYRVLACGKNYSIYHIVYRFIAQMESFKSFESFLQFLMILENGVTGKNPKTSGVEKITAALRSKVNNQET